MDSKELREALNARLKEIWPTREIEVFEWTLGPAERDLPELRVARIAPSNELEFWVYATLGAIASQHGKDAKEFILHSPISEPLHVELLTMVAHYGLTHGLEIGDIIDIGRPWLEGSAMSQLVVTPLYTYPERYWSMRLDQSTINFRWLVPVSEDEVRFSGEYGFLALDERLRESGIDVLDESRKSVV